jgi:hypothetical protein
MKQIFFYAMLAVVTVSMGSWALYMLGRAFFQLFSDWKLGKELDELESQSASRREQRQRVLRERLENGCEHDFVAMTIGLPPHVCGKCGLEQEKPVGQCDHVWRVKSGPIPGSECERCGKTFHPLQSAPDLPRR